MLRQEIAVLAGESVPCQIAGSFASGEARRAVKTCPVGKGSPAGRDTMGHFRTDDGTTSPTRIGPNLIPVAETTWEDGFVGRDTFAE